MSDEPGNSAPREEDISDTKLETLDALVGNGQFERGYQVGIELLAEDPDHPLLHYVVGICAFWGGVSDEEALAHLNICLGGLPEFAEAHFEKSRVLYSQNEFDASRECVETALELSPEMAGAWCQKGWCDFSLGRYDEALKWAEKAVQLEPGELHFRDLLILTSLNAGKITVFQAERKYRDLLAEDPESDRIHHRLGVLRALEYGDSFGAEVFFRDAARINPTSSVYQRNLKGTATMRDGMYFLLFWPVFLLPLRTETLINSLKRCGIVYLSLALFGYLISPQRWYALLVCLMIVSLSLKLVTKLYRFAVQPALSRKSGIALDFGRRMRWAERLPNWVFYLAGIGVAGFGWAAGIFTLGTVPMDPYLWGIALGFFCVLVRNRVGRRKADRRIV